MCNRKKAVRGAVSILLFVILLFDVCFLTRSVFGIFEQKRDNPIYFSESLDRTFDAENSNAVSEELKTLTEQALTYTAMKSDLSLFENEPYIQSEIDRIRESVERNRADTLYFAAQQLEDGTVSADMTENGFIVLSHNAGAGTSVMFEGKTYYAEIDEEKINRYYDELFSSRSEELKINASTVYREAKEYLDTLRDVAYSVTVNGETVTSGNLTGQEIGDSPTQNSGKGLYLKISQNEVSAVKATGELSAEQEKAVTSAAKSFGKDAEIFFAFGGSMLFCQSLENARKLHDECRATVLKNMVLTAVTALLAAAMIAAIVILSTSGEKRKIVLGILSAVFAALIALSVYLLANSVKLYFDPTLGTTWLTVDSGSIVAKACVRACLGAVGLTGLSVCVKSVFRKRI